MPQVVVRITDAQLAWLEGQVEQYRPKSVIDRDLIDSAMKGLDTSGTIPAYCVGAGERVRETQKLPLQFPPQLEVTSTPAQQTAVQAVSDTSSLPCVGREFEKGGSGGKEKKGETNLKPIPENLMQHETLIREFWTCKKGSRNTRAWSLLLTELDKIQNKFGSERTQEQLTLAINGLWKGVTMTNMQRFEPAKKPWQQEPEMKHPAHRDFTAERIAAEQEGNENFLGF
jgi:hypothetical protein